MKTILVTGIGGNVGQGVLRNVRRIEPSFRLIGTNTVFTSAGNYLCDKVYLVPMGYDPDYLPQIIKICETENVDLIIPTTDYEAYHLNFTVSILPPIACSCMETSKIFLDKFLTFEVFHKHHIPFANSWLPSTHGKQPKCEFIAKPREGRGSRGLFINPPVPGGFNDKEYVFQELLKGTEITTAFYVKRNGDLLGQITFERELFAGATSKCIVRRIYDKNIEEIIHAIMKNIPILGCCNIQAIVNDNESIIPFEINGRISGTNSIRSHFGFDDVRYIFDEYLWQREPAHPEIKKGVAMRILLDVIYPGVTDYSEITNKSVKHFIF